MELQQEIPPSDYSKKIAVSDPNNPQQLSAWKRTFGKKIYKFPLKNDKFVHFSLQENLPDILKAQVLRGPAFAVSLSFGVWNPGVQFNHIVRSKGGNVREPNLSQQIGAIIFQTSQIPTNPGTMEEVYWENGVPLQNASIISAREAIQRLKHTPYALKDSQEFVQYI